MFLDRCFKEDEIRCELGRIFQLGQGRRSEVEHRRENPPRLELVADHIQYWPLCRRSILWLFTSTHIC
jgi:hypothetical protein